MQEREAVLSLLEELRPNQNKRNEILESLQMIGRRDGVSPLKLLQDILAKTPNRQTPQRLESVREELQKIRYPRYSKKKEEFEKIIQSLKLSNKIQVIPSPFFEEGKVEIKFKIGSDEEKKEMLKLLEGKGWSHLFQFLE